MRGRRRRCTPEPGRCLSLAHPFGCRVRRPFASRPLVKSPMGLSLCGQRRSPTNRSETEIAAPIDSSKNLTDLSSTCGADANVGATHQYEGHKIRKGAAPFRRCPFSCAPTGSHPLYVSECSPPVRAFAWNCAFYLPPPAEPALEGLWPSEENQTTWSFLWVVSL